MKLDQLSPQIEGKERFHLRHENFIPDESGCYAILTVENDILYIGQAKSIRRRFKQHLDNPEKHNITEFGKSAIFGWKLSNEISSLERGWLNLYISHHGKLPPMNKINSPVST